MFGSNSFLPVLIRVFFFFFNIRRPSGSTRTEHPLSLHDALPIFGAVNVASAVIGTVGTRINGADVRTALTTPEAPDLHGLFARMREDGVVDRKSTRLNSSH